MRKFHSLLIAVFLGTFCFATTVISAEMKWNIEKKLELKSPAIDMAISYDGQTAFVLDKDGNLSIYKLDGALQGTIPVGKDFNKIMMSPEPDTLLLSNSQKKTIEILRMDFIHQINIEGSPFKGPEDAPAVLILFTDFQCPYCARMVSTTEDILKTFPDKVKLVYKNFPLRSHRYAFDAAAAAMAAHKMGKFWEFHDLLFQNYNKLDKEKIEEIREQLKLDKKEFDQHVKDPKIAEMIRNDYKAGIDAGVRGTPALYLNGMQLKNGRPEALKEAIKKELEK